MSDHVHVTWHQHHVRRQEREALNGHRGCVVWFTGLSGCGKSTVANVVDHKLHQLGVHSFLLDGDNIRHGLNASPELLAEHGESFARRFGLGFSADDRRENIRRIAAVAELFASAGLITLTAFVSPYRRDREAARRQVDARARPGISSRSGSMRRSKSANLAIPRDSTAKRGPARSRASPASTIRMSRPSIRNSYSTPPPTLRRRSPIRCSSTSATPAGSSRESGRGQRSGTAFSAPQCAQ